MSTSRRSFLQQTAECAAAAAMISVPALAQQRKRAQPARKQGKEEDVDPPEDLMREHGLLNRVLLIYEEVLRRVTAREQFDSKLLGDSAAIIRTFIESYHEKLEEDYLFPRFRKAGKLVELVDTLQAQHAAGRQLTAQIEQLAKLQSLSNDSDRTRLTTSIQQFVRMYRPHEAREDTILFPALRSIVSEHEFDALGEEFETKEHQLFGKEGFEGEVEKVGEIEKQLGIYDLSKFTPKVAP